MLRGYCLHCGQYVRIHSKRNPRPFLHVFNGEPCPGEHMHARVFWNGPEPKRVLRWFKPWPTFTITGDDDAESG